MFVIYEDGTFKHNTDLNISFHLTVFLVRVAFFLNRDSSVSNISSNGLQAGWLGFDYW
jgi:hypothetical protein